MRTEEEIRAQTDAVMRRLGEVSARLESSLPGTREYAVALNAHQSLSTLAVAFQWTLGRLPADEIESMLRALER